MNSDNNNNNNDHNDINYILYKKIFNNMYLSKLIYNKITEIHYKIRKIYKSIIYKYNEIPFTIIFQHGLISIFRDKFKNQRLKIDSSEPYSKLLHNFKSFLSKTSSASTLSTSLYTTTTSTSTSTSTSTLTITNNEIKEFIIYNKEYLVNRDIQTRRSTNIDLFTVLLEVKNFEILRYLYNDEKEKINSELEYYKKWSIERNKEWYDRYGINLDLQPDFNYYTNNVSSPYSIYFNFQLIKQAIDSSKNDLTTIEFLNDIGIDLKYYNTHLYYWALLQPKRNQFINYIMDVLQVPVPTTYYNNFHYFKLFFDNLILLDYATFKKLIKNGSPVLLKNKAVLFSDIIKNYSRLTSQQQLNQIIIGIYSYYIDSNQIEYKLLVKVIKQLFKDTKYHSDNNKLTITSIKELLQEMNNKIEIKNQNKINSYYNNNNNNHDNSSSGGSSGISNSGSNGNNKSVINSIKKLFNLKLDKSKLELIDNSQHLKLLNNMNKSIFNNFSLNYNSFNFEREIKRIYIFQFISSICSEKEMNIYYKTLLNFISRYQEYDLILNYTTTLNQVAFKKFKLLIYEAILANKDSKLYEYCIDKKILDNKNSDYTSGYIFIEEEFVEQSSREYLSLLDTFKRYGDPLFKLLIVSILQHSTFSTLFIDQLMEQLDQFYTLNQVLNKDFINSNQLTHVHCFTYISTKYNHLFLNWYTIQN